MPTKEDLEAQVREMQEKLYKSGVEKRPSLTKTIEDKESDLLSSFQWQIENLEKETGRKFPYDIIKMITLDDIFDSHITNMRKPMHSSDVIWSQASTYRCSCGQVIAFKE